MTAHNFHRCKVGPEISTAKAKYTSVSLKGTLCVEKC